MSGNRLSKKEFLKVLVSNGITYTSENPYDAYEAGKAIIRGLIDGSDSNLYDYYNQINAEVLEIACKNKEQDNYKKAKASGDWQGSETEYRWRADHNYWEGWKR